MTQMPEAVLATEIGVPYAAIALITDYDVGLEGMPGIEPVTMDGVFALLERNAEVVRRSCSRHRAAARRPPRRLAPPALRPAPCRRRAARASVRERLPPPVPSAAEAAVSPSPTVLTVRAPAGAGPSRRRLGVAALAVATGLTVTSLVGAADAARDRWGDTRPVVVATRDLAPGDVLDGGATQIRDLPAGVMGDAVLAEAPAGAVVRHPILAGEPVVAAAWRLPAWWAPPPWCRPASGRWRCPPVRWRRPRWWWATRSTCWPCCPPPAAASGDQSGGGAGPAARTRVRAGRAGRGGRRERRGCHRGRARGRRGPWPGRSGTGRWCSPWPAGERHHWKLGQRRAAASGERQRKLVASSRRTDAEDQAVQHERGERPGAQEPQRAPDGDVARDGRGDDAPEERRPEVGGDAALALHVEPLEEQGAGCDGQAHQEGEAGGPVTAQAHEAPRP